MKPSRNISKRTGVNENHTTVPAADVEPYISHEPAGTNEAKKDNPLVDIHIHSKRHRLTDPGGVSDKWVVDALVTGGLLPDDSAKYIKGIPHTQEKTKGPEITEITITGWTGFIGE